MCEERRSLKVSKKERKKNNNRNPIQSNQIKLIKLD